MTCPKCGHPDELTIVLFDKPMRCVFCASCYYSQFVNEDGSPRSPFGGDGRTADGCMDGVQVYPYCLKTPGPSTSQPAAGNSNRMVGLLRTPPKGVM